MAWMERFANYRIEKRGIQQPASCHCSSLPASLYSTFRMHVHRSRPCSRLAGTIIRPRWKRPLRTRPSHLRDFEYQILRACSDSWRLECSLGVSSSSRVIADEARPLANRFSFPLCRHPRLTAFTYVFHCRQSISRRKVIERFQFFYHSRRSWILQPATCVMREIVPSYRRSHLMNCSSRASAICFIALLKVPVDDVAYAFHVYKAGASSFTLHLSL